MIETLLGGLLGGSFRLVMYAGVKLSTFVGSVQAGAEFGLALLASWTEADQALLAGILNYWFLNRTLEKTRGSV